MAARKRAGENTGGNTGQVHRLDRFGVKHEVTEGDVVPDPQPVLPAAQTD